MSELTVTLRHFDDAWGHAFESFTAALDGVTEEEAFHQAACYAGEEREDGWPPPGSVAWQVAHVTHCKRYYTEILRRVGETERPEVTPWTPIPTFAALRALLEDAHAREREAIAALSEDALDSTVGNGMPCREFLAMIVRHDTWHASQVVVARRLFRHRTPPA